MLDFAMTGRGITASQALQGSIELARLADRRGFTRYWMAEHHAMPGVTTSSPAVLLARLISETLNIRLGAGGMMLPNFPPLVVAEQFGLLAALAPGRIDLGLGRAPGTDGTTAAALRRGPMSEDDYPQQVAELLHFLHDDFPEGHPYKGNVYAVPGPGQDRENAIARSVDPPSVWMLGSSGYSAQLAGHWGLPFAFAAQLAPENAVKALELYRGCFKPSDTLERPYALVCVGVCAADEATEARRQARTFAHSMMRMMYRKSYLVPSPQEVEAYPYDASELQIVDAWNDKVLHGTASQVVEKINRFQAKTGADEMMVGNLGHSPAAILRSAELIADAYEMQAIANSPLTSAREHPATEETAASATPR
jgi:luciferase family oxidoreductase group 1